MLTPQDANGPNLFSEVWQLKRILENKNVMVNNGLLYYSLRKNPIAKEIRLIGLKNSVWEPILQE